MKTHHGFALFVGLVIAVILGALVSPRLSNDALAVIIGAVCGISATIPVTIGLVIAASRHWGREEPIREIGYDYGANRYAPQPPMVIFAPELTAKQLSPYTVCCEHGVNVKAYCPICKRKALGAPREFKIIGEGDKHEPAK